MLPNLLSYEPGKAEIWQGRSDSLPNERFFQRVTTQDVRTANLANSNAPVFVGFCSDEGIKRNAGRIGAAQGPSILKEELARLPYHGNKQFIDLGNIYCEDEQLEFAQQQLASLIAGVQQQGNKTIVFGGGHEMAWGHFMGLTKQYPDLGIINFDAHLDLRPLPKENYGTSGTPFYQIAQYCQQNNLPFNYCCLGIQPHANTQSLFTFANTFKVPYLTAEQINQNNIAQHLKFIDDFIAKQKAIYLSICLDVFAESHAPGVSAPQALGLLPWQALPLLKYIVQTGKVVSIDIAELSPPWDQSRKTARLAAMIVAELLELI